MEANQCFLCKKIGGGCGCVRQYTQLVDWAVLHESADLFSFQPDYTAYPIAAVIWSRVDLTKWRRAGTGFLFISTSPVLTQCLPQRRSSTSMTVREESEHPGLHRIKNRSFQCFRWAQTPPLYSSTTLWIVLCDSSVLVVSTLFPNSPLHMSNKSPKLPLEGGDRRLLPWILSAQHRAQHWLDTQ